jgi:hypothetical protein
MTTRYVDALSCAFADASRRGLLATLGTAILAALAGGHAETARATRQQAPRLRAATPKRRDGHRRKTRRRRKNDDSQPTTPPPPPPVPPPPPRHPSAPARKMTLSVTGAGACWESATPRRRVRAARNAARQTPPAAAANARPWKVGRSVNLPPRAASVSTVTTVCPGSAPATAASIRGAYSTMITASPVSAPATTADSVYDPWDRRDRAAAVTPALPASATAPITRSV